jgi:hypothetical protein
LASIGHCLDDVLDTTELILEETPCFKEVKEDLRMVLRQEEEKLFIMMAGML